MDKLHFSHIITVTTIFESCILGICCHFFPMLLCIGAEKKLMLEFNGFGFKNIEIKVSVQFWFQYFQRVPDHFFSVHGSRVRTRRDTL